MKTVSLVQWMISAKGKSRKMYDVIMSMKHWKVVPVQVFRALGGWGPQNF